jgi:hypothetical protein
LRITPRIDRPARTSRRIAAYSSVLDCRAIQAFSRWVTQTDIPTASQPGGAICSGESSDGIVLGEFQFCEHVPALAEVGCQPHGRARPNHRQNDKMIWPGTDYHFGHNKKGTS